MDSLRQDCEVLSYLGKAKQGAEKEVKERMEKATVNEKLVTKDSRREKANSSCKIRVSTASRSSDWETAVGDSEMNGMNLESNEKENGGRLVCSGKVPN